MSSTSPSLVRTMSNACRNRCPTHVQSMSHTWRTHWTDMLNKCSTNAHAMHVKQMPWACPNHGEHTSQVWPTHNHRMSYIILKYYGDLVRTTRIQYHEVWYTSYCYDGTSKPVLLRYKVITLVVIENQTLLSSCYDNNRNIKADATLESDTL